MIDDEYFTSGYEDALKEHAAAVDGVIRIEKAKLTVIDSIKKIAGSGASKKEASTETVEVLKTLEKMANEMLERPQYNFFRIGYYVYKNPNADLSNMPAEEANEMTGRTL